MFSLAVKLWRKSLEDIPSSFSASYLQQVQVMKTQQSYNTPDTGAETPVWRWKSTGQEEQVISTWHRERGSCQKQWGCPEAIIMCPEKKNAPSVIRVQLTLACGCQLPIFHHNISVGLKAMETRKKIVFEIFCPISAEPIKLSTGMRNPVETAGKCKQ